MLKRAYAVLDLKAVDGEHRIITGIATTPTTDRMGDVVESEGAKFALPIPLLWQHDSRQPIGEVFAAKVGPKGIEIQARIAQIDEPGPLKDRIDMAWQSIKAKLVRGLSIGFRSLKEAYDKETYGYIFLEWEWLELSAVTIPANADASIATIKSIDSQERAAHGTRSGVTHTPGLTGRSRVVRLGASTRRDESMKPIAEQKASFVAEKQAKVARMNELMSSEGQTLDAAQQEEFDTLEGEVESIDKHLARLERMEKLNVAAAVTVRGNNAADANHSRETSRVITLKQRVEPGIRFARAAMCIANSKGSRRDAIDRAEEVYRDDPGIAEFIKTAVVGGTTANGGGPLLQYTDILSEFVDYLRPLTIIGKFGGPLPNGNGNYPAMTRVPFNVRVGSQTSGATASWAGEGKPAPLSKGVFSTATLDFAKLVAISVLTKEEVRFPSISSETKVRNDIANAIIQKMDADLVDPSNTGTANVKPASVTNGVVAIAASGTTAVAFANDVRSAVALMLASNVQAGSLVIIMSQQIALALSLMRTSLGIRSYPDLTMYGGFVEGIPVIASEAITSLGSPSTPSVVFLNARDVLFADDGVVTLEASDQASLEMSDAPAQDGTTGGGASMVSLWQTDMLGLKAQREINWKLVRAASCQYISGAAYVPQ